MSCSENIHSFVLKIKELPNKDLYSYNYSIEEEGSSIWSSRGEYIIIQITDITWEKLVYGGGNTFQPLWIIYMLFL